MAICFTISTKASVKTGISYTSSNEYRSFVTYQIMGNHPPAPLALPAVLLSGIARLSTSASSND